MLGNSSNQIERYVVKTNKWEIIDPKFENNDQL